MNIFIAGATGVLGHRAVTQLLGAGHQVTGIARSPHKQAQLRAIGAHPVEVSLFDAAAVAGAVAGHDAVCNLATAIPTGEAAASLDAWEVNDRIRRHGSRHLVDAALAAGARAYVQESITLVYADGGDDWLEEAAPVDVTEVTGSALDAEAEAARFASHGGNGVALRFGYFYGPDSAHVLATLDAARAGQPVEIGPAAAFRPTVTTDDAAAAVLAAIGAPGGTYNVADDRPLRRAEHVDALARALGDGPLAPPAAIELPSAFSMLLRSQRVTSRRFREVTGWKPRLPSAWEGWPRVLAEVPDRVAAHR
jgi:nucleoside-diphosphate-sugar epimerase